MTQGVISKCYPEVRQLQADLNERVGADAQLLDASLSELSEGKHVAVHVVCQRLGESQRAAHLSLDLTNTHTKRHI